MKARWIPVARGLRNTAPPKTTVHTETAATHAPLQSPCCPPSDRRAVVRQVRDLDDAQKGAGISLRQFARETSAARSTVQDRRRAVHDNGLPPEWADFLESGPGLRYSSRLVVCVLLFFCVRGKCSVELAAEFFEAMHMRRYVASSPSSLRRRLAQLLDHVIAWGDRQFARMASTMVARDIVLALDENFHWDLPLLGILDVGSGFLFAERLSEGYDGETWAGVVRESIAGYNVCVRAVTRDGGSWLQTCADNLGIPGGSDIFHIQYGVCRATARPLALRESRAHKAVQERLHELAGVQADRARSEAAPAKVGRPKDWDAHEAKAREAVEEARAQEAEMARQREAMRSSIRALGDAHHPVDLTTGAPVAATEAGERLHEVAVDLCEHAARSDLGARAIKALNRVFGQIEDLTSIVAWWHQEVARQIATLSLSEVASQWVTERLVPALYVQQRIALARDASERTQLTALWERLKAELRSAESPWSSWSAAQREAVQGVALSVVKLFPRSTSALEGYNGQDALRHHHHHQMSETFRTALRVVRNYVVRRPDGSTAAERLFGCKPPDDLVDALCENLRIQGRGRRRKRKPPPPLIE